MRVSKIKILSTTFLLLLTNLFSENLSINKKYEPKDYSQWLISNNFESTSDYSQTIAIPFSYPFEASLYPEPNNKVKLSSNYLNPSSISLFPSQIHQSSAKVFFKPTENSEIISYKTNIITDNTHYARDTNSRMLGIGQTNATANTSSGVVFVYLKKNLGLNLDLSMRMMGNETGHAIPDSMVSNMRISYKLSEGIFQLNQNYKVNFVLQLSNIQYTDDRVSLKKLDFNKTSLRSQFLSSGFTLNTKSVMFEGLIRLPLQQQTIFDLDGLLRPELQGRLGMKWYLPEYIQP
ncbi:MAG: hypothetical protein KBA66_08200 [Leptospiraceae bacterium]|nr:hypothetical protein [Leptospiraceae bacterium]